MPMQIQSGQHIIEALGLSKSYRIAGRLLPVLNEVDFYLKPGEMVAILGPSGAGKSTLLHLMGMLDTPDHGTLSIAGSNPLGMSQAEMAHFRNQSIGFVFQFHHLLPELTALENVAIPALIAGDIDAYTKAKDLLDRVGLSYRYTHRPYELSGGEQQRTALARALINQPKLLLADEPTGNLDPKTAKSVYDLMCDLNREKGLSAVVVTHNEQLAAQLDRKLYLQDGRLSDIQTASGGMLE